MTIKRAGKATAEPKNFQAVLEALRGGNTRTAAAHAAGVDRSTIYEWLKNPTLSDAIKRAESDAEVEMVAVVRRASKKTWTAAAWWLERKKPKNWGKRDKILNEHTGKGGGPILAATLDLTEKTDDELKRYVSLLASGFGGAGTLATPDPAGKAAKRNDG
jgi:transposase-like protein